MAIINGEYSEDYAKHLRDDDDGYTASKFLEAYVARVREKVGWRSLVQHGHRDRLLYYWFRALAKDELPDPEEVSGAFAVGRGTEDEDSLWYVLTKAWSPAFEEALIQRIVDGHPERAVRVAALTCLVESAPEQVAAISRVPSERGHEGRLVEFAMELSEIRHKRSRFDGARRNEATDRAAVSLPSPVLEIGEAALALETNKSPMLSEDARQLIAGVSAPSEDVRVFRVTLERHLPMPVADDVRWLLTNTDDASAAVEAIEAAIRHGISDAVEAGLSHRFAAVVARALTAIATPLAAPLPERILSLARA